MPLVRTCSAAKPNALSLVRTQRGTRSDGAMESGNFYRRAAGLLREREDGPLRRLDERQWRYGHES